MNRSRKNVIVSWIIFCSLIIAGCFLLWQRWHSESLLLKKNNLTIGVIYGFPTNGKGQDVSVDYGYNVDGKQYSKREGVDRYFLNNPKNFVEKYFPVIYDSNDPSNSHILLTPAMFAKYNLAIPDSLQWISEYPFKGE